MSYVSIVAVSETVDSEAIMVGGFFCFCSSRADGETTVSAAVCSAETIFILG